MKINTTTCEPTVEIHLPFQVWECDSSNLLVHRDGDFDIFVRKYFHFKFVAKKHFGLLVLLLYKSTLWYHNLNRYVTICDSLSNGRTCDQSLVSHEPYILISRTNNLLGVTKYITNIYCIFVDIQLPNPSYKFLWKEGYIV